MAVLDVVVILAVFLLMIVDSTPSPIASTLSPTTYQPTLIIPQTTADVNHTMTMYNISFNVTINNDYNGNVISVTNITKLINVSTNEYLTTIQAEPYQLLSIDISALKTDQKSLFITDVVIELDSDDIPLINENNLFLQIEQNAEYTYGKNVLIITDQMTTTTAANPTERIVYSYVETHSESDIILMVIMITICVILICICICITIWCIKSVYKGDHNQDENDNTKKPPRIDTENDLNRKDSFELSICQNAGILAAIRAKQLKIEPLDTMISPKQYGEKGIETPGKEYGTPYGQEEGVEKNIHMIDPYNNDDNPSGSDSERIYQNTFTGGMSEREKYAIDDNDSYDLPANALEIVEPANFHTPASSTEYGDV